MTTPENLFAEFPEAEKSQWIAQLEKDLKGKPLTDLQWALEDDIVIDPFYFPADRPELRLPVGRKRGDNTWEIGESYEVDDIALANQWARTGIIGGVESPGFLLTNKLDKAELAQLLDGIDLEAVCTNLGEFYPEKDPLGLLHNFIAIVQERQLDKNKIRGSIDFDPLLDWDEPPMDDLVKAIRLCEAHLPNFKILQVNGRYYHAGAAESSRELALMIAKGSEYLARLSDRGVAPRVANHFLQFSVAVSASYFIEIAKLRALRILWHNVMAAYGETEAVAPEIIAHLAPETQDENQYTNMIRAGTQAMSAVIGGADRLYVLPANYSLKETATDFTLRISRNVQHLLSLESHLDRVIDPAAGSYYIEQATDLLAQKAWDKFREYEQAGEFR